MYKSPGGGNDVSPETQHCCGANSVRVAGPHTLDKESGLYSRSSGGLWLQSGAWRQNSWGVWKGQAETIAEVPGREDGGLGSR